MWQLLPLLYVCVGYAALQTTMTWGGRAGTMGVHLSLGTKGSPPELYFDHMVRLETHTNSQLKSAGRSISRILNKS
jgi:hypothetical protein